MKERALFYAVTILVGLLVSLGGFFGARIVIGLDMLTDKQAELAVTQGGIAALVDVSIKRLDLHDEQINELRRLHLSQQTLDMLGYYAQQQGRDDAEDDGE